jgi:hypothetical protein
MTCSSAPTPFTCSRDRWPHFAAQVRAPSVEVCSLWAAVSPYRMIISASTSAELWQRGGALGLRLVDCPFNQRRGRRGERSRVPPKRARLPSCDQSEAMNSASGDPYSNREAEVGSPLKSPANDRIKERDPAQTRGSQSYRLHTLLSAVIQLDATTAPLSWSPSIWSTASGKTWQREHAHSRYRRHRLHWAGANTISDRTWP